MSKRIRRVLVVDDDPMVGRLIQALAAKEGCDHALYNEPEKALAYFKKNHRAIDFAVIDVSMPVMNGLELVDQMHTVSPGFPVLVLTGDTSLSEKEVRKHGVGKMLHKPFSKADFVQALNETIGSCISP